MAVVSSFVSAIVVFYSFDYISHYDNQNEYYAMVALFLGSMMGLIFSGNLILLYTFWELTAVASWRLISFFRGPEHVAQGNKAFLVTVGGALLMLLGFILLYQQTGTFDLAVLKETVASHPVSWGVTALILAGILSKSATLPFHTWLPDAGVAPSPVTALLHAAVLVKIGVYVFARLFVFTMPLDAFWHNAVPVIAAISALVSAGAALVETDMKRIIAYSTVSQIGFIFLGMSIGSPLALAGALLYILMHGLAKAGLFLGAGIVEQNTHTKDITKLGGLMKTMPWTGIAFLVCSFSVMGVPPLGGFWSKFMVIAGTVAAGNTAMAFVFLAGAVLTILYLLRAFCLIFLGEAKIPAKEESPHMVASVCVCAVLSLAAGLFIWYPSTVVQKIIEGAVR
jgi:NADH:ubiquinone oxidoreductase subunit 5 (subunit L)/multisubunit Na+/H+ antiporter MnhA subunit